VEHDEAYRSFRAGEGRLTELPALLAGPPSKRGTPLPTSDRQGHPLGRATNFRLEPHCVGGWRPRAMLGANLETGMVNQGAAFAASRP
jgi:hypothetical protein